MTDVLAIAYWWINRGTATPEDAEDKVDYIINSDFTETTLDGPTLSAYVSAYIQGAISFETLFYNLQQAEIIPGDHTVEEERSMIESGHSSLYSFEVPSLIRTRPIPMRRRERRRRAKGAFSQKDVTE